MCITLSDLRAAESMLMLRFVQMADKTRARRKGRSIADGEGEGAGEGDGSFDVSAIGDRTPGVVLVAHSVCSAGSILMPPPGDGRLERWLHSPCVERHLPPATCVTAPPTYPN